MHFIICKCFLLLTKGNMKNIVYDILLYVFLIMFNFVILNNKIHKKSQFVKSIFLFTISNSKVFLNSFS